MAMSRDRRSLKLAACPFYACAGRSIKNSPLVAQAAAFQPAQIKGPPPIRQDVRLKIGNVRAGSRAVKLAARIRFPNCPRSQTFIGSAGNPTCSRRRPQWREDDALDFDAPPAMDY